MTDLPATERTRLKRLPERGSHDRRTIYDIIDDALICHVGFVETQAPVVIPMIHARDGDHLYLHGSPASRTLRALKSGTDVCVTITLLDGIVLARAPFHSSVNYRSVVLFGRAEELAGEAKERGLRRLTEAVTPGRWDDCRRPNQWEMQSTVVMAIPLDEASAKVRTGPPIDDEEDYELPIWAGVIPVETTRGEPERDPRLRKEVRLPDYLEEPTE